MSKLTKTIKNISQKQRKIKTSDVMKSLGAQSTGVKIDKSQGPITLFFLRQFIIDRLYSSGGRPALLGTTKRRKKIPLLDKDWEKLEKIAEDLKKKEGINVSPGQIASTLIHKNVLEIENHKKKEQKEDSKQTP